MSGEVGAGTAATRKGLKCFLTQKMELLFVPGEDFPSQRDGLLNNTGADLSLLARLLTVTHLFLHWINAEGGVGAQRRKSGERGREDKKRSEEVCSRWLGLCESRTDL